MAQQIIDTVGTTDTIQSGSQKSNANFTELYNGQSGLINSKGQANGLATLDANGKLPAGQISSLSTTEVFPVSSQAAMLLLSSAQSGDVAVRSDLVGQPAGNTFMLSGNSYGTLSSWIALDTGQISTPSQIGAEPTLGNPTVSGQVLSSTTGGVRSFISVGTKWVVHTTSVTVASGDGVISKTLAGSITITMPVAPALGDEVKFIDGDGNWTTNNIIIDGNGKSIMGSALNFVVDVSNKSFSLIYIGTEWKIF